MKKILYLLSIVILPITAFSQMQDVAQLRETAKSFMLKKDYPNAIMVLNRAQQQEPGNTFITKDLVLNYYFMKDFNKALELILPLIEKEESDDQCYQIAGNIYRETGQLKDCEKMYKRGLKKFPKSGALYNEMGELLRIQSNYDAIKHWEKGIDEDPSYSKNYYNAAKFYFLTTDKVWSILYAEIFINMEPMGNKSSEIKELLLESYKKLFAEADLEVNNKDKNNFVRNYLKCMNKQSSLASLGLNAESLIMIRTRFILEWNNQYADKYPFMLFDYQLQLLQDGLFEAYNQWIFGSVQNLSVFQNWITVNQEDYSQFMNFQKGRIFKIPEGQYYH